MMAMKDGTTTNLEEKRFRVMIDVQPAIVWPDTKAVVFMKSKILSWLR
jgi:hypothetical protein